MLDLLVPTIAVAVHGICIISRLDIRDVMIILQFILDHDDGPDSLATADLTAARHQPLTS